MTTMINDIIQSKEYTEAMESGNGQWQAYNSNLWNSVITFSAISCTFAYYLVDWNLYFVGCSAVRAMSDGTMHPYGYT